MSNPLPRLTRLTELPVNYEIHSPLILLRSATGGAPTTERTQQVLYSLHRQNESLKDKSKEAFLIQLHDSVQVPSSSLGTPFGTPDTLPLCALLTRTELRERKMKQERIEKAMAKRERKGKELDMNWTIEDRDMHIQLGKMKDFLAQRRVVTLSIVHPRRTAAVRRQRTKEIVEATLRAARSVKGVEVTNVEGDLGRTMTIEVRPKTESGGGGKDVKVVSVALPVNEVKLEPKLAEIKAALRKGTNVEVCLEEDGENGKVKNELDEAEIWKRIRTTVRGVKNAVEVKDEEPDSQSKLFKADYKKDDIPRIIEIEPDVGAKMLEVRAQWVASWLKNGWPVQLFVHDRQQSLDKVQILVKAVEEALQHAVDATKDKSPGLSGANWYAIDRSQTRTYNAPQPLAPVREAAPRQLPKRHRYQEPTRRRLQFPQPAQRHEQPMDSRNSANDGLNQLLSAIQSK
jgi:translation initiation factor IF-3